MPLDQALQSLEDRIGFPSGTSTGMNDIVEPIEPHIREMVISWSVINGVDKKSAEKSSNLTLAKIYLSTRYLNAVLTGQERDRKSNRKKPKININLAAPIPTGNWNHFDNTSTVSNESDLSKAGELLDLDRAAFALAHPSTLRRLCFAIAEQHKELESSMHVGYGYSVHKRVDDDEHTIFIHSTLFGHQETPQSARLAVENAAKQYLVDHNQDAAN